MGARQRWIYRTDESGRCRAIPCDVIPSRHEGTIPVLEERIQKTLYDLECRQDPGLKRLENEFGGLLRKAWVDNVERDNHFDRRREESFRRQRERFGQ